MGLASAAALAVASGAAGWLMRPDLHQDGRLSPPGQGVFTAVGRAVLDKSPSVEEGERHKAITKLPERIVPLVQVLACDARPLPSSRC